MARFINDEYGLDLTPETIKVSARTVKDLFEIVVRAFEIKQTHARETRRASQEKLRRSSLSRSRSDSDSDDMASPDFLRPEVLLMLDNIQAEKKWFMGLDLGTQSLKCVVIKASGAIVKEMSVVFDEELPAYKTVGGVRKEGLQVTCPALMWVEALDLLMQKLKKENFAFENIVGISGGAQQHGSVYWKKGAHRIMRHLRGDGAEGLSDQLKDAFSVPNSPVWMDGSTEAFKRTLENLAGGSKNLANMTGSRGFCRFTASQMAKISAVYPEKWADTERVSLVSSFLGSLLYGAYCPIDFGDGSGMNMLDIHSLKWIPLCADFVGPNTISKLGEPVEGHSIIGRIGSYFVTRYGFSRDCVVSAFSGDNLNSLAALRLTCNSVAVSLGTSDTIFGVTAAPRPSSVEGHVFCSPLTLGEYVGLVCFSNGSLSREAIRDAFAQGSWEVFDRYLDQTEPGAGGYIMIEWTVDEVTPPIRSGRHLFHSQGYRVQTLSDDPEVHKARVCRAMVEGQMLRMRHHAKSIGIGATEKIIATGGASQNRHILQILADVFGCPVLVSKTNSNSAALGGAYRALHSFQRKRGAFYSFESATEHIPEALEEVAKPNMDIHKTVYQPYTSLYGELVTQLYDGYLGL